MTDRTDKDKAVDIAVSQIERNLGKGAIMRLGDLAKVHVE